MNLHLTPAILVLCAVVILAAGCIPRHSPARPRPAKSPGDTLFAQGEEAFHSNNYHAAANLFRPREGELLRGWRPCRDIPEARDMELVPGRRDNFPYNRSAIEAVMAKAFPDVPAAQRNAWLDAHDLRPSRATGETWYYSDTVNQCPVP